jgi:replicative DNA helicase
MARIEETILQNLFSSEKFCRVAVPHLKPEYFNDPAEKNILEEFTKFFVTHDAVATPEVMSIELRNRVGIKEEVIEEAETFLGNLSGEIANHEWLIGQTESFCKKRGLYNGIIESVAIIEGKSKEFTEEAIPKIMSDALAISFETKIGHDYFRDAEDRYDSYVAVDEKIPFDLTELNKITKGGMKKKAIYCVAAESGGGKSIFLCHAAAETLRQGKNVVYITLEMSEESINQRIDANLMNIAVDDLEKLSKDEFLTKIDKLRSKTNGCLKTKEYAAGAHAGHFRAYIEELKTKENFTPDLIVIDYLGICGSSRIRMGGSINSNTFLRAVAEELRGLGKEYDVPVLTGVQLNRGGYNNSDIDMTDIAESIGIAQTLDFFFALIQIPELEEMNQVQVGILKNRYGPKTKFILGLTKMQFYNLEESAQSSRMVKTPEMSRGPKVLDGTEDHLPIFKRKPLLDTSSIVF